MMILALAATAALVLTVSALTAHPLLHYSIGHDHYGRCMDHAASPTTYDDDDKVR